MKLPFVSRDRYDELAARFTALEARYHELRIQGANAPLHRATVTPPAPSPEAVMRKREHDAQIEQLASDLAKASGAPLDMARQEASRMMSVTAEAFGITQP